MLQQKLNQIIMAHQINPTSNGMFTRGQVTNGSQGTDQQLSAGTQQTRVSRRDTKPKTLNTPEDSMYYNLLNQSLQDDKKRTRKQSPKKLLDPHDEYYQNLNSTNSTPISTETPETTETPEATETTKTPGTTETPETPGTTETPETLESEILASDTPGSPTQDGTLSVENEDNPYDYRKLLRKTSMRGRLIEQS
ncbi:myosin-IIIa [Tachysurus fulvidraco]|uniref:myosin-IIIa n=1 Tax=Tachysurus fulvidraco TaxID=1234273 RepID=UPI001FEFE64F|nr:myosin-IIIa [Tachysurus fulvidraco]